MGFSLKTTVPGKVWDAEMLSLHSNLYTRGAQWTYFQIFHQMALFFGLFPLDFYKFSILITVKSTLSNPFHCRCSSRLVSFLSATDFWLTEFFGCQKIGLLIARSSLTQFYLFPNTSQDCIIYFKYFEDSAIFATGVSLEGIDE